MKKTRGNGKIMMGFGLLLTVAALALTGYNLWGEYQATKNANEALLQVAQVIAAEESGEEPAQVNGAERNGSSAGVSETEESSESASESGGGMTVRMVDGIDYIGIIEIPSLSLQLPIINEWDDAKLKIAPCRYVGSAYMGDLILSGHSYKNHFRYIRNLTPGERVIFTDFEGTRFVYEVTAYEVIGGDDVEGMLSGEWDLSLFTCTYNGSARHTVRCKLVPEENPWMAEIEVPDSIYQGAEGGFVITETVKSDESTEAEETSDSESAVDSEQNEDESDDEIEEIYQDADLINDLETQGE